MFDCRPHQCSATRAAKPLLRSSVLYKRWDGCCSALPRPLPQSPNCYHIKTKDSLNIWIQGKHPWANCVCEMGREIFPTQPRRAACGKLKNTPVVCSERRSLPTAAGAQRALLFPAGFFIACFASEAPRSVRSLARWLARPGCNLFAWTGGERK